MGGRRKGFVGGNGADKVSAVRTVVAGLRHAAAWAPEANALP